MYEQGAMHEIRLGTGIWHQLVNEGIDATNDAAFLEGFRSPASSSRGVMRAVWDERRGVLIAQVSLFFAATAFGIAACRLSGLPAAWFATISAALTVLAQLCERYFYFVTSTPFKMPGPLPPPRAARS